jgi:hypothetical protein
MTLESLDAWAAAPAENSSEYWERALVVIGLTDESPSGARVLKEDGCLDLRGMEALTSLPNGLEAQGDLNLSYCTALTQLPEGLRVRGSLYLAGCTALVKLSEGLAVEGELALHGCTALTQLPKRLKVGGTINLGNCTALTELPEGLAVEGNLNLRDCTALTQLPEEIRVGGDLDLGNCTALTRLPEELAVGGHLELDACTALTQLSGGVSVGGDLDFRGCTALAQLPERLAVGGQLRLSGCTALTQIPEGLTVGGGLYLMGCTALPQLPEGLTVGGRLDLSGCTSLTHLPEGILQWPLQSNGQRHDIDVCGSGIREARFQALARILGPGVRLLRDVYEHRATRGGEFADLSAAMAFWRPLASSGGQNADPENAPLPNLHADPGQLNSFLAFLDRLRGTADFQNINSRPLLAQRIVGLTDQLATSETLAALCHERIGQALESCGDRVSWAMNQLELTVRVHQAQHGRAPEQELHSLGRSLLRLQVVHQHAAAKAEGLRVVDPIEVYLAYETQLAQPLGLPLSTQKMLYARCSYVTEADLELALNAATEADADPRQLEAYLATWEPWQGLLRRQQAQACDWQGLSPIPQGIKIHDDQVCVLTRESVAGLRAGGKDVAAVRDARGQWEAYDFDSLLRWWAQQGTHPVQRTPMRLEHIHRTSNVNVAMGFIST